MTEREIHIAFGRHSRIPMCCILYFVDEWDRACHDWEAQKGQDTNYVLCPACKASGFRVELRICREECGKECAKDFWAKAKNI